MLAAPRCALVLLGAADRVHATPFRARGIAGSADRREEARSSRSSATPISSAASTPIPRTPAPILSARQEMRTNACYVAVKWPSSAGSEALARGSARRRHRRGRGTAREAQTSRAACRRAAAGGGARGARPGGAARGAWSPTRRTWHARPWRGPRADAELGARPERRPRDGSVRTTRRRWRSMRGLDGETRFHAERRRRSGAGALSPRSDSPGHHWLLRRRLPPARAPVVAR